MPRHEFALTYRDGRRETLAADFHHIDSRIVVSDDGAALTCGADHIFRTLTPDRKGFLPEVRIDMACSPT
jgi:hypothetical protein